MKKKEASQQKYEGRSVSVPPIQHRLPPDVRLHRVRYEAARVAEWKALLSEEERERLEGYGVVKRQREFLLGRVAARQLVGRACQCTPRAVVLAVADDGAVEVGGDDAGGLCLSITHTQDEAAAALAERPVGVDLEPIVPRPERLHRFLLSKEERPLLGRLPMTEVEGFVLCWALKEAVLKALRCGLRRSPKIVRLADVDVDVGTARLDVAPEGGGKFEAAFVRDGALWLVVAYETRTDV